MTNKEQKRENILYKLFIWITVSCHLCKEIYQIPCIILPQGKLRQNSLNLDITLFFWKEF